MKLLWRKFHVEWKVKNRNWVGTLRNTIPTYGIPVMTGIPCHPQFI